jgi:hypothetical protein
MPKANCHHMTSSFHLWKQITARMRIKGNVVINPFLFIRGLACPSSVHTSLAQNCLELTISGFPYNFLPVSCGDNGFKKNRRTSICVEIRPQSAFLAFRVLLPSANNSADWSGRVWQPSADNNGHLTIFFSNFEACQTAITICRGLSRPTQEVQKNNHEQSMPNGRYNLQRAVTLNWKGGIALWELNAAFFSPLKIHGWPTLIGFCIHLQQSKKANQWQNINPDS